MLTTQGGVTYACFSDLSGRHYGYCVGIADLSVLRHAPLMSNGIVTMFYDIMP